MKKIILIVWLVMMGYAISYAQSDSFKFEFKINGVSDTVVYLGNHFAEKKFVIDTVPINSKGEAVFEGDSLLKRGIYLFVMPSHNNNYFEFLVGDDQKFKIETDTTDYVAHMEVKGSEQNELFNAYQREMGDMQKELQSLQKEMKNAGSEEDKEAIREKIAGLSDKRLEYMRELIENNEASLMAAILQAMIEIEIPEPPKDEEGNVIDSSFRYRYYKEHYFDNIDFSEAGLLRTPVFKPRLDRFFKKVVPPIPDSIIPEVNKVIKLSQQNDDVFRYVTSHLLNYFETAKIMGMDEVFVSIAKNWYLSGEAFWADSTLTDKIHERVMKISPNLIGQVAPDLQKMPTYDRQYASLHLVDAEYTVLVFYEPNCGHCKTVVPKLHQIYEDTLQDENVEVFAVYTQVKPEEWKEFIEEKDLYDFINVWDPYNRTGFRDLYDIYSTPVIYVLDSEKKIMAKRIDVDYITEFIRYDRKDKERKKGEEAGDASD